MSKPLPDELSEDQISIILRAAGPLPIADRDAFLDDVVDRARNLPRTWGRRGLATVPRGAA